MSKRLDLIDEVLDIGVELDARELGGNCILEKYLGTSYVDLCDKGIKIFEELKKNEIDE